LRSGCDFFLEPAASRNGASGKRSIRCQNDEALPIATLKPSWSAPGRWDIAVPPGFVARFNGTTS
jgi:hypothetical protein